MKSTLKENVSVIEKISKKMPKTINEAINFNEEDNENLLVNDEMPQAEGEVESPAEEMPEMSNVNEKAKKLIDDIRKMSLRAMAELADTPECPEYENLKRIWQLCDKAVSEKQEQRDILQKQNR